MLLAVRAALGVYFSSLLRRPWLAPPVMAVMVLLAFSLRLHLLEQSDIWWDEGWSIWLARQDLGSIAGRTAADIHPPLHYWFLHFWDRAVGESEFAVRFSTVFFGMLAVPLVYRLGRDFLSLGAGLGAGLFVALSRFHLWWSQEVRMYALLATLGVLSAYCLLGVFCRGGRRYWAGYVLSSIAALYVCYLAVGLLVAWNLVAGAYLAFRARQTPRGQAWRWAGRWVGAQLVILLLYTPWLLFYAQHGAPWGVVEPPALGAFLRLYATVLSLGVSTELARHVAPAWGLTALAVGGVGAAMLWRRVSWQAVLLVAVLLAEAPVAVVLAYLPVLSVEHPQVSPRYLLMFLPFFGLAIGLGLTWVARLRRVAALLLAGMVLVQGWYLADYYSTRHRTQHLDALASYLEAQAEPGDALILNPDSSWPVFVYRVTLPLTWYLLPKGALMSYADAGNWLSALDSGGGRVWLLTTPEAASSDPSGAVQRWLAERRPEVFSQQFGRNRLTLYDGTGRGQTMAVVSTEFSPRYSWRASVGSWQAVGRDEAPRRVWRGDVVYLYSYWQPPLVEGAPLDATPVVVSANGAVVATGRRGVLVADENRASGGLMALRQQLVVGRSLPDGEYSLVLRISSGVESAEVAWGSLRVVGGPFPESTAPDVPADVALGGQVRFRGYSIGTRSTAATGELEIALFWEAVSPMDTNYTVFVHLVDARGGIWRQHDGFPVGGALPTVAWEVGELVKDEHTITYEPSASPGELRLLVGLYDVSTGERLPVSSPPTGQLAETAIDLGPVRLDR